jgi:hypothetical protein
MDPGMCTQVDEICCDPNGTKSGLKDCVRGSTERQHRPMVVCIHRVVEEHHTGCRSHGIDQGLNSSLIPTFAEVGNTFDDSIHRLLRVQTKKPED